MNASSELIQSVLERLRPLTAEGEELHLHEPRFGEGDRQSVLRCIESGWVSSAGGFVDELERRVATFTGATSVVAVVNGTAALHLALLLSGVGPGDEVLIPALSFVATANAVRYCGATPHFVDCEPVSLGLDVVGLRQHLTRIAIRRSQMSVNRRTGRTLRALVSVHTFGHPGDLDEIARLAAEYDLALVEDAAEALGSSYRGTHVGRFGRVAALSFNGNKIITTGGGGAVLTDDEELGRRARHLATTAKLPHPWSYVHDEVGFNYRMPGINAALGCSQMDVLPATLARKRRLAAWYRGRFRDLEGAQMLEGGAEAQSNQWLNTLVLDAQQARSREALLAAAHDAGIFLRPSWELLHRLVMYRGYPRMELRNCEALGCRLVNLPSSPHLADRLEQAQRAGGADQSGEHGSGTPKIVPSDQDQA